MSKALFSVVVSLLAFSIAPSSPLHGQCIGESLTPGGFGDRAAFGSSILIHADRAIVGDPLPSDRSPGGSLGLFALAAPGCWEAERWLQPRRGERVRSFGHATAAAGEWLVVGAPALSRRGETADRGAVFVFKRMPAGYAEVAVLRNPDARVADRFGEFIATDGERIAVSARWSDLSEWAVYPAIFIYHRGASGWELESRIEGYGFGPTLGEGLAIDGDMLVAASPRNGLTDDQRGSVFVFRWGSGLWTLEEELTSRQAPVFSGFGASVDTWDGWVAVGAPRDGSEMAGSGAVEIFRSYNGAWLREQVLEAPRQRSNARFGAALEIDAGRLVVGAPGSADLRTPGSVTLFELDARGGNPKWRASGGVGAPAHERLFGARVALRGEEALSTSTRSRQAPREIFPISVTTPNCDGSGKCAPDCNNNGVPDDCDVASGEVEDCDFNGVPDECQTNPSDDCDENGVLDSCELADGVARDANANGVLDHCEPEVLRELMPLAVERPWKSERAAFGTALASDGETLAVGAPFDESSGVSTGAVYLYTRGVDSWRLERVLVPDEPQADAGFGGSVAMGDDYLAVGASGFDGSVLDQGAVYLFRRGSEGWVQEKVFLSAQPEPLDHFGRAVALAGGELYVGAPGYGPVFNRVSSVHVFGKTKRGWQRVQRILGHERFGASMLVKGNRMFVGAPSATRRDLLTPGSVHVLDRSRGSWEKIARLEAMGRGERGDRFGESLAWEGRTLLVGAPGADEGRGVAYVYLAEDAIEGARPVQRLAPPGRAVGDRFGASVLLLGETWSLVGAPGTLGLGAGGGGVVHAFEFHQSFVHSARVEPLRAGGMEDGSAGFGVALLAAGPREFLAGAPGGEFQARDVNGRVSEWRVPEISLPARVSPPKLRLALVPTLVGRAYWECGPMYALESHSPMGANRPFAWMGLTMAVPFLQPTEAPMFDAIFSMSRNPTPVPLPSVAPLLASQVIGREWERSYVVSNPASWRWRASRIRGRQ